MLRLRGIKGFRSPSFRSLSPVPAWFKRQIMTRSWCRVANLWKGKLRHKFPMRGHLASPLLGMWGSSLIAAPPSSGASALETPIHQVREAWKFIWRRSQWEGLQVAQTKTKLVGKNWFSSGVGQNTKVLFTSFSFHRTLCRLLGGFPLCRRSSGEREFGKLSQITGASP